MTSTRALVGLPPGPLAGRRFGMTDGYLVLGGARDSALVLGGRYVSPQHAALTVNGTEAWVEDLGSTNGTFVNDRRVQGRQPLHHGDVLRLADVVLRYDAPPPPSAGYVIGSQSGGSISNVGGNQYLYYQQRDSLLREIAATRTRGRRLIGVGAVLLVVGFGIFAAGVLGFVSQIADGIGSGGTAAPTNPFGPAVFGVPSGVIGWALAVTGMGLIVLGIVLHVVATARRRRVDQDAPPNHG